MVPCGARPLTQRLDDILGDSSALMPPRQYHATDPRIIYILIVSRISEVSILIHEVFSELFTFCLTPVRITPDRWFLRPLCVQSSPAVVGVVPEPPRRCFDPRHDAYMHQVRVRGVAVPALDDDAQQADFARRVHHEDRR